MSEHTEQVKVFEWAFYLKGRHPELDLLFAVPNGSYKGKASAGRFRAEGLMSGVPDICLPVARGLYSALFIEMKDGSRKPTENQAAWLNKLGNYGNCARIARSADEAIEILKWYIAGAE